jgi:glycosyltransferase involved in cell wall biosynthesis
VKLVRRGFEGIVLVFNDVIDRRRFAHVAKLVEISSRIAPKVLLLVSRLDADVYAQFAKFARAYGKYGEALKVIIMDSTHPIVASGALGRSFKPSLIREWLLTVTAILRLARVLRRYSVLVFAGTLNFPAVTVARIIGVGALRVYAWAGGFSWLFAQKPFGRAVDKVIELATILLTHHLVVESKSMANYIPAPWPLKRVLLSRTFTYGALYNDLELCLNAPPPSKRRNVVAYIGALEHHRAVIELVHSFRLLARKRKDVDFIIVGNGPLWKYLHGIIERDDELRGRIRLIPPLPHKDLAKTLKVVKVLVWPSRADGLPNTIIEALACNVIVVSTLVGGIGDVVREGDTGFVLENLNVAHIASAIERALEAGPSMLDRIAATARELVDRLYSFRAALKRWMYILRRSW